MSIKSKLRGHDIEFTNGIWVYCDTGQPTAITHLERACGHCNQFATREGHDACLGTLKGVMNACCGHGISEDAYVQFLDGSCVRGSDAQTMFGILMRAD